MGVDAAKRTGEITDDEVKTISDIIARPTEYNIPKWFLNRQKDPRNGQYTQLISNQLDTYMREDLERMRKSKQHRGLRHHWGIRVRGQRTSPLVDAERLLVSPRRSEYARGSTFCFSFCYLEG